MGGGILREDLNDSNRDIVTDGSTDHFNGTVGTSSVAIPASAGNVISEVLIRNPKSNSILKDLLVSFDGGTTFFTISRNDYLVWGPRDNLTQIYIKGNLASTDYEIIMNRLPDV